MKPSALASLAVLCWLAALASCTVVKQYRPGEPFLFENAVKLRGIADNQRQTELREKLNEQIEDSALVLSVSKIPWPYFPWVVPVPVIKSPFPYDAAAIARSAGNMRNLMGNYGYKSSLVRVDTAVRRVKDQLRVRVSYEVEAGRLFRIDSVGYMFTDSTLQRLAVGSREGSVLRRGEPFENAAVDQELNRLVGIFQNNGYNKFSREDIIAEADSTNEALIDPSLDPFEYVQRLAEAKANMDNPKVDIRIRLNRIRDESHLLPFRIGNMTVYTDMPAEGAPAQADSNLTVVDGIGIVNLNRTFDPAFIARQIEMKPGALYTRDNYSRTLNNLNRLGAWQNINIQSENLDSAGRIDYLLRLTPAKRQYFSVDLEGSSIINNTQLVQVGSGRVGLALNFSRRNRNIAQRAIQLENNLRAGIEFNNFQRILSGEITQTNRLTIPGMATPFSERFEARFQNTRTVISADFSYIDRFKYFNLRSFNTFLGYEWKKGTQSTWQFKPLNFEYTRFKADSLFLESIIDFPLLLYTYNNGLILGSNITYTRNLNPFHPNRTSILRVYAEQSGIVSGLLLRGQTDDKRPLSTLYRFIKLDADFRHIITRPNSSLHFRFFGGAGRALPTLSRRGEVTLPFFKSYVAGGPNSMRGWQIRKLGVGSNISFDTTLDGRLNDKYADIQLETNLEYRFNLFPFYGFWMRGAIFTDIGNIWFRTDLDGQLTRSDFRLDRLYNDLALASGLGLRIDFSYFLLRFDLGFPLKDPRYGPHNTGNPKLERFYSPRPNGWFVKDVWHRPVFQFAIGYPF